MVKHISVCVCVYINYHIEILNLLKLSRKDDLYQKKVFRCYLWSELHTYTALSLKPINSCRILRFNDYPKSQRMQGLQTIHVKSRKEKYCA